MAFVNRRRQKRIGVGGNVWAYRRGAYWRVGVLLRMVRIGSAKVRLGFF
jgi:hypothetical protein